MKVSGRDMTRLLSISLTGMAHTLNDRRIGALMVSIRDRLTRPAAQHLTISIVVDDDNASSR